jgi:catechol 2,3-dioxygenase-like lactoylglutathione lyase family enzyme
VRSASKKCFPATFATTSLEKPMKLQVRRVMLFARNMKTMTRFYEEQLGLRVLERSGGFVDLDGGGCNIALHRTTTAQPGRTKICFYTEDVSATRAELMGRGVPMGKDAGAGSGLKLCDAKDPEGNIIQLSNRR